MKKLVAAGAVVVAFLGPLAAFAGPDSPGGILSVAVSGGVSYPLDGEFKETFFSGPSLGATLGYRISSVLQAVFELGYRHHGLDHGLFSPPYTVTGGDMGIFSLTPGIKVVIPGRDRFKGYLLAETGLFLTTIGELTLTAPGYDGEPRPKETESGFGYLLGIGVEYGLTEALGVTGEIRFTDIFPGSKSGDDASHIRDFSFRLGARWTF